MTLVSDPPEDGFTVEVELVAHRWMVTVGFGDRETSKLCWWRDEIPQAVSEAKRDLAAWERTHRP